MENNFIATTTGNRSLFTHFCQQWESDFLFKHFSATQSICLVCHKVLKNRLPTLKHHYYCFHKSTYGELVADARQLLVDSLKLKLQNDPPILHLPPAPTLPSTAIITASIEHTNSDSDDDNSGTNDNDSISSDFSSTNKLKAKYVTNQEIAKAKKPFSDVDFIKRTCSKIVRCFGIHGQIIAECIEDIPHSDTRNTNDASDVDFAACKLKASYVACYEIAKAKKSFSDGEFIKQTCCKIVKCFGEYGHNILICIEDIPLSRNTVYRRLNTLGTYVQSKVEILLKQCSYYSIAMCQSKDMSGISELLLMVKTIDDNFVVCEEMFRCIPMYGPINGSDILNAVTDGFKNITFEKLSSVYTEGTTAMTDSETGFTNLMKSQVIVPITHCTIQHYTLLKKFECFKNCIDNGSKIIKAIKSSGIESNPLYTKLCSDDFDKAFLHIFEMRSEINEFLKVHVKDSEYHQSKLIEQEFVTQLAFLTDIIQHLNEFILNLQHKNLSIFHMISLVDAFYCKLTLLQECLHRNDLTHFSCCKTLLESEEFPWVQFNSFAFIIDNIRNEYDACFQDLAEISKYADIFFNPMKCLIIDQPCELQLELCDIQTDLELKSCQKNVNGVDFWKKCSKIKFPKCYNAMLKFCSMFGGMYLFEQNLLFINHIKKNRSNLKELNLETLLCVGTTNITMDFDEIYAQRNN